MKKFLKAYLIAMAGYWIYIGTGEYMKKTWDMVEIIETGDVPELAELKGDTVRTAMISNQAAQKYTFNAATEGWKKELKALIHGDKRPWEE